MQEGIASLSTVAQLRLIAPRLNAEEKITLLIASFGGKNKYISKPPYQVHSSIASVQVITVGGIIQLLNEPMTKRQAKREQHSLGCFA